MRHILCVIATLVMAGMIIISVSSCRTTGEFEARWNIHAEQSATGSGTSDVTSEVLPY